MKTFYSFISCNNNIINFYIRYFFYVDIKNLELFDILYDIAISNFFFNFVINSKLII